MSAKLRANAAQIVAQVAYKGHSLTQLLDEYRQKSQYSTADASLLQALCFGTLRFYPKWQALINDALKKPMKSSDGDIQALIALGMFQLLESRVPAHAAISETVSACKILKKTWAKGLINAILRRLQREPEWPAQLLASQPWAEHAFPKWIWKRLNNDWPEEADEIMRASNIQGPMTLRVNTLQTSVSDYQQTLKDNDINCQAHNLATDALILQQPLSVEKLPGFFEGKVSVQDAAAQMAARLLQFDQLAQRSEIRVLDACSAPGGKTGHLLETAQHFFKPEQIHCVALDKDADRLQKVADNLKRLNLSAQLIAADAAEVTSWWDGKPFDRILIDAPCSGTGVIRRHPDIKLLRRNTDITELVNTQRSILQALWPLLADGGLLAYATCSVFKEENEQQIDWFLQHHTNAVELEISYKKPLSAKYGWQIPPAWNDMDGFYYAVLQKNATT